MSPISCSFGTVPAAQNWGTRAVKLMVHHVQSHCPPSCARTAQRSHTQATLLTPGHDKPSVALISAEDWEKLCCDTRVTHQHHWHSVTSVVLVSSGVTCSWDVLRAVSRATVILSPCFGKPGTLVCLKDSFTLRSCELSPWGQQQCLGGNTVRLGAWDAPHQHKGGWIWGQEKSTHHAAWLSCPWQQDTRGPEQVSLDAVVNTCCRCRVQSSPVLTDLHLPPASPPLLEAKGCV